MKHFRTLSLLAVSLFCAHATIAQTGEKTPPKENSGVHDQEAAAGPIVVNWNMKRVDGTANLTVNPDGTYLFSGTVKDKRKNRDFDISMALKSSLGGVIVFHFVGNDAEGVQWSKQGKSPILKENFKTFVGKIRWAGEWRLPLSSAGAKRLYEEREEKKKQLRKEEAEARRKKDEKLAQAKKEELERVQREETAAYNARVVAGDFQHSSSGGSSVGSDIESAISTVGSVVGTVSGVVSDIAGLF